jgi:hypothetical protein
MLRFFQVNLDHRRVVFYSVLRALLTKTMRDAGANHKAGGKFRQSHRLSGPIYVCWRRIFPTDLCGRRNFPSPLHCAPASRLAFVTVREPHNFYGNIQKCFGSGCRIVHKLHHVIRHRFCILQYPQKKWAATGSYLRLRLRNFECIYLFVFIFLLILREYFQYFIPQNRYMLTQGERESDIQYIWVKIWYWPTDYANWCHTLDCLYNYPGSI